MGDIQEARFARQAVRAARLPVCAWLLLALTLAAAGCSTGPEKEVAVTPPPVPTEELLSAAETDIDARRFQLAYERLSRLGQAALETPRGKFVAAEVLLGLSNPKEALTRFQDLQTDATYGPRAYQGMGLSLAALGDYTTAKPQLERAVAADPTLWRSWMALGRVHDSTKNWTEAQAAYDKALALQPNSPLVMNNVGMSLMMQHRYAEAADTFQRVLAADPTMDMTRSNLRIALAWQGKYDEALVGTLAGTQADALNNVGYVALLRGDQQAAQKYFAQAMEASPTYHQRAARNLETLKLLAKARAAGNEVPTLTPPAQ